MAALAHLAAPTPNGWRRCWRRYAPTAIIASDELKAQQTAQPLADRLGLAVEVIADLHEHERRTVDYLDDATFQATMARFFAEPDALVFGEETASQALARFSRRSKIRWRAIPPGILPSSPMAR